VTLLDELLGDILDALVQREHLLDQPGRLCMASTKERSCAASAPPRLASTA